MIRESGAALSACILTFLLCAVGYPAAVALLGQTLFPAQAEGSLLRRGGEVVGSELIAQPFASPRYFWPRPSAVNYAADAAGGSNLGPTNPALRDRIAKDAARYAAARLPGGPPAPVPLDLVTASGSGLDPHVSPAGAREQAARVAAARGWPLDRVLGRIEAHTDRSGRLIGAPPRVNVLTLNLDLDLDLDLGDARGPRALKDWPMSVEPARPSPEQFLNLIRRQERGRLKVYLGSNAGVGKTYAMLREGNRLKNQGVDVAVGVVETHGRAETAEQVGGLEVIPPRSIEYRGVTLRELDLDAVLARRPTVCLVDELAHTNAPGSRNAKRYQDVEALLRAGVHVITTVNVQHLESLYDEVERATGVKVKERLPDSVLAEADQIVNVDLSAEDLLERMKAGKVYPPDRAEAALENFFTPANLTRLREITLTEMAHLIDRRNRRAEADRAPASATDRVMVGLSSRSPNAQALLRKTARLADRLNAPWYAVYIQTPSEDLTRVDAATQRLLGKNLELAQQLGGVAMNFKGPDVASTIAAFAREYEIRLVVVGKTRQPWYRRLRSGSVLEQLLNRTQGVDILVVDA